MIYYLTSRRNRGVMQAFLAGIGSPLAPHLRLVAYERLLAEKTKRFPAGTYIFTSIGRSLGRRDPPSPARQWATRLHASLVAELGPERVLNDPAKSLPRFELLRRLGAAGENRFRVFRAGDRDPGMRFPVFLRPESGTVWRAPALLADRAAYESALQRLRARPRPEAARADADPLAGMIAIEFCDTADARRHYRKYGCFVVGGRIVPRHLFRSRNWLVKEADLVDADALEEERAYLEANPHAQRLGEVCRMANISYGRIDYALAGGVPQIWEINATPQIVTAPGKDAPGREAVHGKFAAAFIAALRAVDPQEA